MQFINFRVQVYTNKNNNFLEYSMLNTSIWLILTSLGDGDTGEAHHS